MKTTLIVIQNDADHAQAKALIEKLSKPAGWDLAGERVPRLGQRSGAD
jgi:hypothetical protein